MTFSQLFDYNSNLLKSVLLLVLAVSGNFVGNTLGCKTQYYMTNNMYVKHLLLIFIIFFTLNYTTGENENPKSQMLRALAIWGCFLMFTKQNITFTGISAGLLVITYLIDTFSSYYSKKSQESLNDEDKQQNDMTSKNLNKTRNILFKASVATIVIGFAKYFMEKQTEYKGSFDMMKFLLGKVNCASLM
jgi:Ca2+/Na+ antiporter